MQLTAKYKPSSIEIKNNIVVNKVKEIVRRYDEHADIILFGSRARDDWHEESDWDFLVLSQLDERSDIKDKIRSDVSNEIELVTFNAVFILFHNKKIWEEKYNVTPIYYNIEAEGIIV